MTVELLSLSSAFLFASSLALVRIGVRESNPFTGTAVTVGVCALFFWVFALAFLPAEKLLDKSSWVFALDGAMALGLSRWILFAGIAAIGVSRASSISGASPLFATLFAIFLLRESATWPIITGAVAIVLGIAFISYREEGTPWRAGGIILSLSAAVLFGISPNLRKWGFGMGVHPISAIAVGFTTALAMLYPVSKLSGEKWQIILTRHSAIFFTLAGLLNVASAMTYYYSIYLGKVVIVGPLANSYPLFNILIAYLFMREGEGLNWKVISGALLIISGATAIMLR